MSCLHNNHKLRLFVRLLSNWFVYVSVRSIVWIKFQKYETKEIIPFEASFARWIEFNGMNAPRSKYDYVKLMMIFVLAKQLRVKESEWKRTTTATKLVYLHLNERRMWVRKAWMEKKRRPTNGNKSKFSAVSLKIAIEINMKHVLMSTAMNKR